mmetsp:Transcript_6006/g.13835  ORF Transcript_6006/g.13835 Transcript_6006/m.13835 type:complete len:227 (-) Transcript_6006:263-943(-)
MMFSQATPLTRRSVMGMRALSSSAAGAATPPNVLDQLRIRVEAYGPDRHPLSALAHISESKAGGYEISPFDSSISQALRKSLQLQAKENAFKVYYDAHSKTIRIVPSHKVSWKSEKRLSLIRDKVFEDDAFMFEAPEEYAELTPRSSQIHKRISRAWSPVDLKPKKVKAKSTIRVQKAAMAAESLDLSVEMVERLEKTATKSQKALRQLMKRATQKAFNKDPELAF